jgi:hypothetical protein
MAEEQQIFVDELKNSSPELIIEMAYELVMREDFLLSIENEELPDDKAQALLKLDKPLDAIYREWLDNDYSHMDMVRDTISDCANFYINQQNEKQNNNYER